MTFEIEKNVPMPEASPNKGRPRVYPFPEMEVGDSFVVEIEDSKLLRSAAGAYSRKYGGTFTVRIDRKTQEVRCWRMT